MQTDQRARQSNLELLRIVAMLAIVLCHFSTHGGFQFPSGEVSVNRLWTQFLQFGGNLGANIFILISGYFLIEAAAFKPDKALKLVLQALTYSVPVFLIFTLSGASPFSGTALLTYLFPITYCAWWFASAYFILYLLSPYLNRFLRALDRKSYQKMLVLLAVCWCILPTFSLSTFESNRLLWFVCLYAASAYLRLHVKKIVISPRVAFLCAFGVILVTYLAVIAIDIMESSHPYLSSYMILFLYHMQRLPTVLAALFLFLGFLQIDIGCNRVVNKIASATFGIYLIHENGYIRPFLWDTLFKNASFANSPMLVPYSIAVSAAVFLCCALIELLRITVLESHYMGLVKKISRRIDNGLERLFSRGSSQQ